MENQFNMAKQYISNLLDVTTHSFLQANNSIYDSFSQLLFMPNQLFQTNEDFGNFVTKLKDQSIYHLTDLLNLSYCFVVSENWCLMIGPYSTNAIKKYDILALIKELHLPLSLLEELMKYYNTISIIDKNKAALAAQTLLRCLDKDIKEAEQIDIRMKGALSHRSYEITKKIVASDYINQTHSMETQFMEKITQGNAIEAKRLMRMVASRSAFSLPNNISALNSIRQGHAIARTLVRIAALNAGVPSAPLHAITSADRNAAEKAKTSDEINRILFQTIDDVCSLVMQYRLIEYRPVVRRAIKYVLPNLNESLNVKDIAKQIGVAPNYLSSVFKTETGQTLTEYIRTQRLESSVKLLTYTTMSIQEISSIVGIEDSNYFTKLFKHHFGTTPTHYRQHPTEKD